MKKMIVLALFSLSFASFASETCPAKTQQVATCLSTPKSGDQKVAANIFDSITICSQGAKSILIMEKNGESDSREAKVTRRMGGTSYLIQEPDVDFTLSVTTGLNGNAMPAHLKIEFKAPELIASSTYSCKL